MKKSWTVYSLFLASALVAAGCAAQPSTDAAAPVSTDDAAATQAPGSRTGVVVETMDAANYTYVKLDTGSEEIWAAAPKFPVSVGQQLTIPAGMAMESFHSDSLDRDFELIYFVDHMSAPGEAAGEAQLPPGHPQIGAGATAADTDLSGIEKASDGVTVAELYASKAELAGSKVSFRGKVVKANSAIMGRNWFHIQDGTGDAAAGTHDITITSDGTAAVGATVLVTGTLTLDKDFGAGYRYALIVEDASMVVE